MNSEQYPLQTRMDSGFTRHAVNSFNRVYISEDPIGFIGGDYNLFRYVDNSTVNFVDPLGLIKWKRIAEGTGKIIAGGAAVVVAAGTEIGSIGAATLVAAGLAFMAVPTISSGITDVVLGILDRDDKAPCTDAISIGALIYTKDIEKAADIKFYFDLATTTHGSLRLLAKTPTKAEEITHFMDLINLQYESLIRATQKKE